MSAHLLVQVPGMLADPEPIHACNRHGGICYFHGSIYYFHGGICYFHISPMRITWAAPGQALCSLGCGCATRNRNESY